MATVGDECGGLPCDEFVSAHRGGAPALGDPAETPRARGALRRADLRVASNERRIGRLDYAAEKPHGDALLSPGDFLVHGFGGEWRRPTGLGKNRGIEPSGNWAVSRFRPPLRFESGRLCARDAEQG